MTGLDRRTDDIAAVPPSVSIKLLVKIGIKWHNPNMFLAFNPAFGISYRCWHHPRLNSSFLLKYGSAQMADDDSWLAWLPHHPGDPGPEVYAVLAAAPADKKAAMAKAINAARAEVEAARVKGYQAISAAIDAASKS
jgi:hypothetical protein